MVGLGTLSSLRRPAPEHAGLPSESFKWLRQSFTGKLRRVRVGHRDRQAEGQLECRIMMMTRTPGRASDERRGQTDRTQSRLTESRSPMTSLAVTSSDSERHSESARVTVTVNSVASGGAGDCRRQPDSECRRRCV